MWFCRCRECQREWPDFFTAIPFICFGFQVGLLRGLHVDIPVLQCHVSSVPVYAGLRRRSVRAYLPLVAVSLAACLAVYSLTGVFGFLTFHKYACINSDILRNYRPQDPAIDVARVMLILVMITSYPILAFCGRYCILRQWCSQLLSLLSQNRSRLPSAAGTAESGSCSVGVLWVAGESAFGVRGHHMAPPLSPAGSVCTPDINCHQPYWRPRCYTHVCLPRFVMIIRLQKVTPSFHSNGLAALDNGPTELAERVTMCCDPRLRLSSRPGIFYIWNECSA